VDDPNTYYTPLRMSRPFAPAAGGVAPEELQYQIPGGPFFNDAGTGVSYMLPGYGYVNETGG
jgi:hypothetical protein